MPSSGQLFIFEGEGGGGGGGGMSLLKNRIFLSKWGKNSGSLASSCITNMPPLLFLMSMLSIV